MAERWGRFTVRGSNAVEAEIGALLEEVARTVSERIPAAAYRALVLLGGYGRGEGGVVTVEGRERLHNNLDFLLIANGRRQRALAELRREVGEVLEGLVTKHGIQMDLGVTTASLLRWSPGLVMWYDMRFGHKTVLGDCDYVPSLTRFTVDRIPAWDVRDLLVNRGTLLLIAELLLERAEVSPEIHREAVKHVVKAIIGYGDAFLFSRKDYHWSYQEKLRRIRRRPDVPKSLRAAYCDAVEFRFQPRYEEYALTDVGGWIEKLRPVLEPVHLACEAGRLRHPDLDWDAYPEAALRSALLDDVFSPRATARKVRNALRSTSTTGRHSFPAGMGYRCAGFRDLLSICFPVIAYRLDSQGHRELARCVLGAGSTEIPELRRAYIARWGEWSDPNFGGFLVKHGISLEAAEVVA